MNDTEFDAELAVADYRRIIAQRDEAPTQTGRTEFNAASLLLRAAWKDWQGEDSLHEKAFGKLPLPSPESPRHEPV